ncbi:hypothetical protein [Caloranaerobacter sp. DY30410]|uniref:hypothetical protein n=1 Tax=Caloranaerobacter sp. DY30410 TaxID=3238305 RepID=UPI003D056126
MKKFVIFFVICFLFLPSTLITFAQDSKLECSYSDKLKLKIQQAKEFKKNKVLEKLDDKISKYYQQNKNKILALSDIRDFNTKKTQNIIKAIGNDIINCNLRENNGFNFDMNIGIGEPTGSNNIDYTYFMDGDIILVHDGFCPYGYYRHGGIFVEEEDKFISAQIGEGVIWESKSKYHGYDEAIGLYVDYKIDLPDQRKYATDAIVDYLKQQLGKPYKLSGKNDESSWYCTKLPWKGWNKITNVDIDGDSGIFCFPDNIYSDTDTVIFEFAN